VSVNQTREEVSSQWSQAVPMPYFSPVVHVDSAAGPVGWVTSADDDSAPAS